MTRSSPPRARALLALLAFVLALGVVPHRVCARDAEELFGERPERLDALATGVARWVGERPDASTFATGSRRFDGEWRFGSFMMAGLGFAQLASTQTGDARRTSVTRLERALDALIEPDVRAFDTEAHGEDAIASLPATGLGHGHLAYLAYAGLPLALAAELSPESPHAPLAHAVAKALAARIDASPDALVETYPGEVYPVDLAMALATIAVDARARRTTAPPALARGLARIRASIDPASGLLYQALAREDGTPRDRPRASGTALAAFALLYADRALSAVLWRALREEQLRTLVGFGAVLEYPEAARSVGDIDSGPVVLGLGVSATGFALAASRAHGDADAFAALLATTHLFGAPVEGGGARTYATGGPLGDAILFAMLTAPTARRAA